MMTINPDELAAEIVHAYENMPKLEIDGVQCLRPRVQKVAEIIRKAMYGKMGPARTFHEHDHNDLADEGMQG